MSHRVKSITVVVVNWNRRDLLRSCLRSLGAQAGVDFEVVLVDNGSLDGSADMAAREFGRHPAFRLTVIRNVENRGFCAANNQGIAIAGSEFVALLNNDAEAGPSWLASMAAAFDRDARIGMAASKIVVWDVPGRID